MKIYAVHVAKQERKRYENKIALDNRRITANKEKVRRNT